MPRAFSKGELKLRPSPSVSATAFAPGSIKKGNDGNKYVIVVASNGVPRWQKVPTGTTAMKKPGSVKKSAIKKSVVAMKAMKAKGVPPEKAESPYVIAEKAAKDVCRRLTKGLLQVGALGKSPDTKGYVLLRDFAKTWMSKPANYKMFQKMHCRPAQETDSECEGGIPAYDPVLTTIAYLPSHIIDCTPSVDEMRVLFSDEKDKQFFSLGVVNGYFRGDAANQIYHEFLIKKKYKPSEISAQLKGKDYKIMENLMVKSQGIKTLISEHQ